MDAVVGDKVRIKAGGHRGQRGVIRTIDGEMFAIKLDGTETVVNAQPKQVTNYSLAARKAWATEPNRGVGRRKGTRLTDRVSVTLRLDRELWHRFLAKEKAGAIEDRTAVVNQWFRERLDAMDDAESQT